MSIRFDKTTGKYLSRASGATGITGVAFAMSAWVYAVTKPATSGYYGVFRLPVGGYDQALEFFNQAGNLKLALYEGATETYSATLSTTTWYHVVMVRESATVIKLYVNGALDHTGGTNSVAFSNGQLNVGCWDSTTDNADIRICGIKIWNQSLTLAQVGLESNYLRPSETANLAIWDPVFPGSGERARDYSGNGRNFTENGTLTDEDPPPVSWGGTVAWIPGGATTAAYALALDAGSYTLTGAAATVTSDRLLNLAAGSYTLTGQAATITHDYPTNLAAGAYTLTGAALTVTAARLLNLGAGAYTLTGADASLLAARVLTLSAGAYTLTGADATLTYTPVGGYTLNLAAGSYAVTGASLTTLADRLLNLASGSYTLTGQSLTVLAARLLALTGGTYTISGQDLTTQAARLLNLGPGTYTYTGQDAATVLTRLLSLDAGTYTLTGANLELVVPLTNIKALSLWPDDGVLTIDTQTGTLTLFSETGQLTLGDRSSTLTLRPYAGDLTVDDDE